MFFQPDKLKLKAKVIQITIKNRRDFGTQNIMTTNLIV